MESRSAVIEVSFLYPYHENFGTKHETSWYRSKDKKLQNPYGSFMLNKKWKLEEEFNNHLLRFQQVKASTSYFRKWHFNIPGWIDSHWSSFRSRNDRRRRGTWTPGNETFLFPSRFVVGRNSHFSHFPPGWDHLQPMWTKLRSLLDLHINCSHRLLQHISSSLNVMFLLWHK